jgi:DNA polymerase III delta subunit
MTSNYSTIKDLEKELSADKIHSRYLFLGDETGEKNKFINRISSKILKDENTRRQNTFRCHVDMGEYMQGALFALSPPMFAGSRLCIFYNIDSIKQSKENIESLSDVVANADASTTIIFTSDEKTPAKIFSLELLKLLNIYQFWMHFDNEIFAYIDKRLKESMIDYDQGVIKAICEKTGKDIALIDEAVDLICLSGENRLQVDMVKKMLPYSKEANIFEFVDSLLLKNKSSIKMLKSLLDKGTPELVLLAMITRQLETIEKYHAAKNNGVTHEAALKQAGVHYRADQFTKILEIWPQQSIFSIYHKIGHTEFLLKSGGNSSEFIMNPITQLSTDILSISK